MLGWFRDKRLFLLASNGEPKIIAWILMHPAPGPDRKRKRERA